MTAGVAQDRPVSARIASANAAIDVGGGVVAAIPHRAAESRGCGTPIVALPRSIVAVPPSIVAVPPFADAAARSVRNNSKFTTPQKDYKPKFDFETTENLHRRGESGRVASADAPTHLFTEEHRVMSTYPTSPRSAFMEWCKGHQHVFSSHAEEIGLTTEEATAFSNATTLGDSRMQAQEEAQQLSKVATQQVQDALDDLNKQAAKVVRNIRAYAESSDDPNAVYAIAQIPPRSDPTPAPPPGQPTHLTVTLDATLGTVTLDWKADNPTGTTGTAYLIRRRLPGESNFTIIGICGKKSFIDNTLMAGPDSVEYIVQGQRGDVSGPVSPLFNRPLRQHCRRQPNGQGQRRSGQFYGVERRDSPRRTETAVARCRACKPAESSRGLGREVRNSPSSLQRLAALGADAAYVAG